MRRPPIAFAILGLSTLAFSAQAHDHRPEFRAHTEIDVDFDGFACGGLSGIRVVAYDTRYVPQEVEDDALRANDPNWPLDDGGSSSNLETFTHDPSCGAGNFINSGIAVQDPNNVYFHEARVDGVPAVISHGRITWKENTCGLPKHQYYDYVSIQPAQCPSFTITSRPFCEGDASAHIVWFQEPNNTPPWEWPLGGCNRHGDPNDDPEMHLAIVDPNFVRVFPETCCATFGQTTGFIQIECVDDDADGVCDNRDNCPMVANPVVHPAPFQTVTAGGTTSFYDPNYPAAGQLDDDADGYGNACDADFNNTDNLINPTDLGMFIDATGRKRSASTCHPGGFGGSCAIYDLNGTDNLINPGDLNLFRALYGTKKGKNSWQKCTQSKQCNPAHPDFHCAGVGCPN